MQGAIEKSYELAKGDPNVFLIKQFSNPANTKAHYDTTSKEIMETCPEPITAFIAGIGTGGSITGIGEQLKIKYGTSVEIIGVEPEESPYISKKIRAPHNIQGIGAGMNLPLLNQEIIDRIITISLEESVEALKKLALYDGILAGLSSGAVLAAAIKVASELSKNDVILCLFGDGGRRYLNFFFQ
jgi:cysteine synthase A